MNEVSSPQRTILPVIIGLSITAVLLVFLAYAAKRRTNELNSIPQLTLVYPGEAAVLDTSVVVRFTSTKPLTLAATGWGYQQLHLHAWLGDAQLMPAAADIQAVDASTYEWRISAPPGPERVFYLAWADAHHHAIPQGASQRVTVSIR